MGIFGRDERLWPTRDAYYGGEGRRTSYRSAGGAFDLGDGWEAVAIPAIGLAATIAVGWWLFTMPCSCEAPKQQPEKDQKQKIRAQANAADIFIGEDNYHQIQVQANVADILSIDEDNYHYPVEQSTNNSTVSARNFPLPQAILLLS